jgi:TldD protein
MTTVFKEFGHILARAKSLLAGCGCEYAEIRLSGGLGTAISLSGDQTDAVSTGQTVGGSVRMLRNGAFSFIYFNDVAQIEHFFKRGIQVSKSIEKRAKTKIRSYKPVIKKFRTEKAKDFDCISLEEKFGLISSYNKILKSSHYIQTTRAVYRDLQLTSAFLNTEGSEVIYDKAYCGISLSSVARNGAVIQPFHDSFSGHGGYELAENRELDAERVARTAVDLLAAESIPGGTYRVVVDQKLAGIFIHEAFGHLSEADFIHENERLRTIMVPGKRLGPEGLNVIDDGNIPGLAGFIPCDDEGVLPEKTQIISNGLLSARLHSRETAEKMDEAVTGNARAVGVMNQPIVRMTNTYIENGSHDKHEIFEAAGNGVYAVGAIGGETNLEMFTFTSGCGYEIRAGKIGKMYKNIVLSGNVFSTMSNIVKIGNDLQMFGGLGGCGKGGQSPLPVSFGGPHILMKNILIGGAN